MVSVVQSELAELRDLQREIANVLTQTQAAYNRMEASRAISCLDSEEIQKSRQILHSKRISQLLSMLPQTANAIGASYPSIVLEYSSLNHFNGVNAIHRDAVEFAKWLGSLETVEPWKKQLAIWESIQWMWYLSSLSLQFFRFDYDFRDVTGQPKAKLNCWLVYRIGSWGDRLRVL